MGEEFYNIIDEKYSDKTATKAATVPPSNKYTQTNYPLYGTDYFHNDTATTATWIKVRAYRTLYAQAYIYDWDYSINNNLYCTNMWGTYSKSQGGAHEGIDFYEPDNDTPNLYSPVSGVRVTNVTYSHQLAIYDANITDTHAPTGGKTYSFLHMTNLSTATYFSKYHYLGVQGIQGNTTGYHLHFEVQLGRTGALSSGNDHVLSSASPYQLTEYLGEAPMPS